MSQKRPKKTSRAGAIFVENMRQLMELRGFSRTGLGKRAGVTPAQISKTLAGITGLSLFSAEKIADALGSNLADMVVAGVDLAPSNQRTPLETAVLDALSGTNGHEIEQVIRFALRTDRRNLRMLIGAVKAVDLG